MCVCVCVSEIEREREREGNSERDSDGGCVKRTVLVRAFVARISTANGLCPYSFVTYVH